MLFFRRGTGSEAWIGGVLGFRSPGRHLPEPRSRRLDPRVSNFLFATVDERAEGDYFSTLHNGVEGTGPDPVGTCVPFPYGTEEKQVGQTWIADRESVGTVERESRKAPPRQVVLRPLTKTARQALGGKRRIRVRFFPFLVGRLPSKNPDRHPSGNDLDLHTEPPYHVSKRHFILEQEDGKVWLRDCGSSLGCIVNGQFVRTSECPSIPLRPGENTLCVGRPSGQLMFVLEVPSEA